MVIFEFDMYESYPKLFFLLMDRLIFNDKNIGFSEIHYTSGADEEEKAAVDTTFGYTKLNNGLLSRFCIIKYGALRSMLTYFILF